VIEAGRRGTSSSSSRNDSRHAVSVTFKDHERLLPELDERARALVERVSTLSMTQSLTSRTGLRSQIAEEVERSSVPQSRRASCRRRTSNPPPARRFAYARASSRTAAAVEARVIKLETVILAMTGQRPRISSSRLMEEASRLRPPRAQSRCCGRKLASQSICGDRGALREQGLARPATTSTIPPALATSQAASSI